MSERSGFANCCTKKEIFIAGGQDSKNSELARVESYDIKKDVWKNLPQMNKARNWPSICLFRQRFLYVFGGQSHSSTSFDAKYISLIERLDVREGYEFTIVTVKKHTLLKGHSLSSLQISATHILVFGSYFKLQAPTFAKLMFFTFDQDRATIRSIEREEEDMEDDMGYMGCAITDTLASCQGWILGFN